MDAGVDLLNNIELPLSRNCSERQH